MQAGKLQPIVKVVDKVTNRVSISTLYKSVELNPNSIRACSEYGNVEGWVDMPGLTRSHLVDSTAFIGVMASLPEEADIVFGEESTKVLWQCGAAKGHLSTHPTNQSPPQINHEKFDLVPPKYFAHALKLASTSCEAATISVGMFGLVIEPLETTIRMMSSNNVSFAMATLPKDGFTMPKVTIRPPVQTLIGTVLDALGEAARMDVTESGIFVVGPWMVGHFPLGSPLEHNIGKIIEKHNENKFSIQIDSGAIKQFLARARLLADKGFQVTVSFKVEDGKLLLEHSSLTAAAEQYFLSTGLDPTWTFSSVKLPVDLLLGALDHVRSATLDYLKGNILILRGEDPDFLHIIGGVTQKKK